MTTCQNCAQLNDDAFRNVAESGIRTIKLRYSTVNPSESPKPGKMLFCLKVTAILFLDQIQLTPLMHVHWFG